MDFIWQRINKVWPTKINSKKFYNKWCAKHQRKILAFFLLNIDIRNSFLSFEVARGGRLCKKRSLDRKTCQLFDTGFRKLNFSLQFTYLKHSFFYNFFNWMAISVLSFLLQMTFFLIFENYIKNAKKFKSKTLSENIKEQTAALYSSSI